MSNGTAWRNRRRKSGNFPVYEDELDSRPRDDLQ